MGRFGLPTFGMLPMLNVSSIHPVWDGTHLYDEPCIGFMENYYLFFLETR